MGGGYIIDRSRGVTFSGITDKISRHRSGSFIDQGREIIRGSGLLPNRFFVSGCIAVFRLVKGAVGAHPHTGKIQGVSRSHAFGGSVLGRLTVVKVVGWGGGGD